MLSRVAQQGDNTVPSFVIPVSGLRSFFTLLAEANAAFVDFPESSLRVEVRDSLALQQLAQGIQRGISEVSLPSEWIQQVLDTAQEWQSPTLIFRASLYLPGHSEQLEGLLPSHLGLKDEAGVEMALKGIWGELFRARSLFYWQQAGIELKQLRLAVLVQPIQSAIASGKVEVENKIARIHATWGLGHSWVRGEVDPDLYIVDLETGKVQSQKLGHKLIHYALDPTLKECLQRYPSSEAKLREFALEEKPLGELIQLVQEVTPKGHDSRIEWTYCQSLESEDAHILITQFDSFLPKRKSPPLQEVLMAKDRQDSLFVKGIPASPGEIIASTYLITGSVTALEQIPSGCILVTDYLTPDWLPLIQNAVGVIVEAGGLTSHVAIIARELGIPAIVSAKNATKLITMGETIRLDGDKGEVHRDIQPKPEIAKVLPETEMSPSPRKEIVLGTDLFVNLSQTASIATAKALSVNGVGLLRSELMLLPLWKQRSLQEWLEPQYQEELVANIEELIIQFACAFTPQPVFYRSVDWRSADFGILSHSETELNPLLGMRGTLRYQYHSRLFEAELQALKRLYEQGYNNIRLIVPFVRSVGEFSFCRDRAIQFGLTNYPYFQLWLMAEVPSVLWLLPQYQQAGVQGIAIGTNDLSQLLLGFDHTQPELATLIKQQYPVLSAFLKELIIKAKQLNLPCTICGEVTQEYPQLIRDLVDWGIDGISVAPEAVESVRIAIAQAEKKLLLEAARKQLIIDK